MWSAGFDLGRWKTFLSFFSSSIPPFPSGKQWVLTLFSQGEKLTWLIFVSFAVLFLSDSPVSQKMQWGAVAQSQQSAGLCKTFFFCITQVF